MRKTTPKTALGPFSRGARPREPRIALRIFRRPLHQLRFLRFNIFLYDLYKLLIKNPSKQEQTLTSKRSLILITIPYITFFIKPLLETYEKKKKTVKKEIPLKSKRSLILITIPYIPIYIRSLFKTCVKTRKPAKSKRCLILMMIPYILLYIQSLVKTYLQKKNL